MADFAKLLGEKMAKAAGANRAAVPEVEPKPAGQGLEGPTSPLGETKVPEVTPTYAEPAKVAPAPREARRTVKPAATASRSSNLNRVTVNLFDADRRALAIIKEHLANAGQDFTNRSDSIKIALRLAAKAKKEELAALLLEVRAEDRRFSGRE
jgi:hypothetical protein